MLFHMDYFFAGTLILFDDTFCPEPEPERSKVGTWDWYLKYGKCPIPIPDHDSRVDSWSNPNKLKNNILYSNPRPAEGEGETPPLYVS